MEPEDDSVEEGIAGLLDRALTKGAILNADLLITVNDVPLVGIRLQAAIANMETMVKYGIMTDWDLAMRHVDDEYLAEQTPSEDNSDTETGREIRFSDDEQEKIIE